MKKTISTLVDGALSGIIVSMGCTVFLQCESKALGAVLFSFGLFVIITFHLGLYTGKAGYLIDRGKGFLGEVLLTLAANFSGVIFASFLLRCTRLSDFLKLKSREMLSIKFSDAGISVFILAFFCGIMMYIAIEGGRRCRENSNHIAGSLSQILPVMIFVYGSFNHSVADFAFFSLSGFYNAPRAMVYFPLVILGNGVGGMFLPLLKRLSITD